MAQPNARCRQPSASTRDRRRRPGAGGPLTPCDQDQTHEEHEHAHEGDPAGIRAGDRQRLSRHGRHHCRRRLSSSAARRRARWSAAAALAASWTPRRVDGGVGLVVVTGGFVVGGGFASTSAGAWSTTVAGRRRRSRRRRGGRRRRRVGDLAAVRQDRQTGSGVVEVRESRTRGSRMMSPQNSPCAFRCSANCTDVAIGPGVVPVAADRALLREGDRVRTIRLLRVRSRWQIVTLPGGSVVDGGGVSSTEASWSMAADRGAGSCCRGSPDRHHPGSRHCGSRDGRDDVTPLDLVVLELLCLREGRDERPCADRSDHWPPPSTASR